MRRGYEEEDELNEELEEEIFPADEEWLEILLGEIPDKGPEQTSEQLSERVLQHAMNQTIEQAPERAAEQPIERIEEQSREEFAEQPREEIAEKTREFSRKRLPEKEPEKDLIDRLMEEDMPWKQEEPRKAKPWKRTAGSKPRIRHRVQEEDEEADEENPRRKLRQEKKPVKAKSGELNPPENELKAPGSVEKDPPIVTVLEIICGFSAVTAVITTAIAWYVQILRG